MNNPTLPRAWLPVLLNLFETGSRKINGQTLYQCYQQFAQAMIAHHWLKKVDRLSTVVHYNKVYTVDWDHKQKRYQTFDPVDGWIDVPADYLNVYRVNFETCGNWLRHLFQIHPSTETIRLYKDILIDLGATGIGGDLFNIFLCSQLNDHKIRYAVQKALRKQGHRGPSLLIIGKHSGEGSIELPPNFYRTKFTSLLCEQSDNCHIDHSRLQFFLSQHHQKQETFQSLSFSEDYRVVYWKNRSYKLTKKQGDIFEALWKAGGYAHKDYLQAVANTQSELRWIMRNRRDDQWVTHPLWGTLLVSVGDGYYKLDENAEPP